MFLNFWLHWVSVAVRGLSPVVVIGGYSSLRCAGLSLWWPLLLLSTSSRHPGFSSCGTCAQQLWLAGSRAQAQQLWCTGLVAPRHVGSSGTRARTRVPCIGRWTPNHCATREVPTHRLFNTADWKWCITPLISLAKAHHLALLNYNGVWKAILIHTQGKKNWKHWWITQADSSLSSFMLYYISLYETSSFF